MKKFLGLICLCLIFSSCTHVKFNERERLADRIMMFDANPLYAEMRGHVITPREAAIGGFSAIGAGGCGCN